ncbi:hypothetical protein HMPREF9413_4095 [Paenibacillus sp. HGF7]|nr:hypothetical protein HMPREF9413_4095 [Paenibacillus sp. HGF7]
MFRKCHQLILPDKNCKKGLPKSPIQLRMYVTAFLLWPGAKKPAVSYNALRQICGS